MKQITIPLGFALVEAAAALHVLQSRCSRSSSSITTSFASPRPALRVGAPTLYDRLPVRVSFLPPFFLATVSISPDKYGLFSCSSTTASQTSSAFSSDREVPKIDVTPRTFKQNDAITFDSFVFPFCRATIITTVLYLNVQSGESRSPMISKIWISAHSCQRNNFIFMTSLA